MPQHEHHDPQGGISRGTWVLIGFLAIGTYFLLSEHRAHFIQFLPFLLLAACPLLHMFHGHGGHGGHGGSNQDRGGETDKPTGEDHTRHQGGRS